MPRDALLHTASLTHLAERIPFLRKEALHGIRSQSRAQVICLAPSATSQLLSPCGEYSSCPPFSVRGGWKLKSRCEFGLCPFTGNCLTHGSFHLFPTTTTMGNRGDQLPTEDRTRGQMTGVVKERREESP